MVDLKQVTQLAIAINICDLSFSSFLSAQFVIPDFDELVPVVISIFVCWKTERNQGSIRLALVVLVSALIGSMTQLLFMGDSKFLFGSSAICFAIFFSGFIDTFFNFRLSFGSFRDVLSCCVALLSVVMPLNRLRFSPRQWILCCAVFDLFFCKDSNARSRKRAA
ncbi:hypothetical protein L596_023800 [Steinernema carpocapsae]|nr:hypothetical protein L596_023800 [Steinernema carpocapsae]